MWKVLCLSRIECLILRILTSGLPRCESKTIAVQLSEIASDLGSRTYDFSRSKIHQSSDEKRHLLNSKRKIDLCGAWILAELLGEYHRFLYLHTKLQLNAFNEKIRFDVKELISMQIQGWMQQKANQRSIVSRLIKLSETWPEKLNRKIQAGWNTIMKARIEN